MDKRRLLWLFNKGRDLVYLLRVEFSTDDAAPITSPYVGEIGSLTVVDTNNLLSVSSGALSPSGTSVNTGNPRLTGDSQTRVTGKTVFIDLATLSGGRITVGWDSSTTGAVDTNSLRISSNLVTINEASIFGLTVQEITSLSRYQYCVIQLSTGMMYLIKGGSFTDWTLIYRTNSGTTTPLYPSIGPDPFTNGVSCNSTVYRMRAFQLSAPFDTDYGIATNRVASPAVNETTTSEANALIEQTWTAVTGETWEFMTRRTDDNNCWIVRCDQAGSTIKLIEKNAGVETERSSAAQTWTNGTQYRLVVIQDGNTIRTYVANVAKNTYTSATFNNSATGVKTNKAGSNLVTYPRTLSGAALTELQRWTS